jgi:3-phosphoshikimate 1-carboxyvinyltransferase
LRKDSQQGDSKIAELFKQLGVKTSYEKGGVRLSTNGNLTPKMQYNFVDQPDMAQTFVVCCCMLNVPFRFSGLQSLKIKETDRIAALINEMKKLGYVVAETSDSVLEWNGERCEEAADKSIDTYDDHRMALACAPIAFKQPITINHPEVVSKSYPTFWESIKSIGFKVKEIA